MTLLNTMKLSYPRRRSNKKDQELLKTISDFEMVLDAVNKVLDFNIDFSTTTNEKMDAELVLEVRNQNEKILELREKILSDSMLISKETAAYRMFHKNESRNAMDTYSVIGLCPRVKVNELKETADKFGFCIFNEKVFGEKNNSDNVNVANEAANILRDKGYKIYYLSPLSGFDYASFINSGSGVYNVLSYWGVHFQTFNTLALSLNVFRDLYSIVDTLKKENEEIRRAIESDRNRVDAFHQQFKQYVDHVHSNLRVMESSLNNYIEKENKKHMKNFETERNNALKNNERHKHNRYKEIESFDVYEKKTGNYKGNHSDLYYFADDNPYDYDFVRRVSYVDQFLPVPKKAFQYEKFYAKHFNVSKLSTKTELKEFKSSYNIANVKRMIQSELGNNYMMLAIKGDVMNPTHDDAIVLSSWGEGISEETMIALGVKNV